MIRNKLISVVLIIITIFSFSACTDNIPDNAISGQIEPKIAEVTQNITIQELPDSSILEVHYIDVGQADSSLIVCDGYSMLIDGGNVADSSLIVAYLEKQNIDHIDYMVCTHAHEDHVGGLSAPLSIMPIGAIYAPSTELDSNAYQTFKQKAAAQNSEIMHPTNYERFPLGSATVEILAAPDNADNINNTSIILKITHGDNSFLFMGDAEREEEQSLLNKGLLKSDVLKVGHHGSDTSTSYVFLREVMPEYAVISVGKDNSYGHPSETVLSRLRDADVTLYRTDLQGDIIFKSDGSNITVTTEKNENIQTNETAVEYAEGTYIGNKNSKKFHRPDCRALPSEKNRVEFSSREEAVGNGYSPCGICRP